MLTLKSLTRCSLVVLVVVALSASSGCVEVEGVQGSVAPLEADNSYTWNSYTWNSYTWNSYTWNSYTWNSLDGITLPAEIAEALDDPTITPDGRTVGQHVETTLRYIHSCAMPAGNQTAIETAIGRLIWLEGGVGIAPEWGEPPPVELVYYRGEPHVVQSRAACDEVCQQKVSACVIARINAFGRRVPISISGAGLPPRSSYEAAVFDWEEGGFFGNIFIGQDEGGPQLYSCTGQDWDDDAPPPYAGQDPDSGLYMVPEYWNQVRICGEDTHPNCGVVNVGRCDGTIYRSSVCTDDVSPYGGCVSGGSLFGDSGERFGPVVTVHVKDDLIIKQLGK